jgi:GT2 family glycosyltransferase
VNIFSIGITTKNRWSDLYETLLRIRNFGWTDIITIIIDDHSNECCPFNPIDILPKSKLLRFEQSQGLIVRRNQIANLVETPFYLSLDDDSYPVSGSIEDALNILKNDLRVFCISFPIYNPIINEFQVGSIRNVPYQTRSFIGCAHVLDVKKFKELQGYRELLIHQGEEIDISARAYNRGLICMHYPGLLFHHNMSLEGRKWERMDYFGARNNVLWNDWYLPRVFLLPIQLKNIMSRILLSFRVRRKAQITGIMDAIRSLKSLKHYREPIKIGKYLYWIKLPNS